MKQKLPEVIQPIVLGVDDWAFRKGVNYRTILIDMGTSRPIDLLASRERSDLKRWLKKYPNVKIVTRDRASSYSSAINEVCPDAIQVADRFHLLMNLSDALDKYFKSVQAGIRLLIKNKTEEIIIMSASSKLEDKAGGEPVISFHSFSTSTGHLSGVCQFTDISSLELVALQTVQFKAYDAKFVKTGDIVIMRHIYNYRPGFNLFNCSNVRNQDVTIHALPGMGVFGTHAKDIALKRFSVRPSGRRIMSGNVDATHFVSCTGTIEIDSCYFEGMGASLRFLKDRFVLQPHGISHLMCISSRQ